MKKTLIAAALTASVALPAHAEIRINGFANLVGGVTSSDETLYGYDENFNFSQESLFALQASGSINEKMTATVQILARGENDYDPEFQWAYVTYRMTNNTSFSAGRFRLPLFKYSDSLDIGYSHHWVAVPQGVYDVPFNNIDGFRLDYADYMGDWEIKLGASVGTFENEVGGGVITGDNTYLVSAEISNDWLNVRTVYGTSTTTFSETQIDGLVGQFSALSPAFGDFYAINEDTANFFGAGFNIDRYSWFLAGEFTRIEIPDSFSSTDDTAYLTAGFRAGKWTPSLTYSVFEGDELKGSDELAALGEPLNSALRPIINAVNDRFAENYQVASAAIRYDYAANFAIKVDVSKYTDDLVEEDDATLVRFAINYVF
ncbi:topoisomerase IV [Glaciecola sp. MH2013]|uniref:topoisomerase IV n=1 Tax=Glaciecola sp. MH2013 TaxID=2785524 RepID=UPI00189F3DD7|nr:topoisomerase IV [Glaciecola sp. MH2013]MBF7072300.1 topoisomerase IV [Glaciecola sp. MH2013]